MALISFSPLILVIGLLLSSCLLTDSLSCTSSRNLFHVIHLCFTYYLDHLSKPVIVSRLGDWGWRWGSCLPTAMCKTNARYCLCIILAPARDWIFFALLQQLLWLSNIILQFYGLQLTSITPFLSVNFFL